MNFDFSRFGRYNISDCNDQTIKVFYNQRYCLFVLRGLQINIIYCMESTQNPRWIYKKRQLPVTVCSQKNKEISIRASRQYEVHLFPHIKSYANKIFYICLKYCTATEMNKNIMMIAKTQRYMHLFSFHCIALLLHFIMNSMYYICHFILDISFYFKFYFYWL